ncbi:hypothetical protein [Treponema denticola]|uniref:hypothetical protein n=1 Tax=Treponema denticola TaxID=158 RepID=UPI002104E9E3|nr:hypothetical protein [Treponema denticola]UTY25062.1 hypothetical protein E4N78_13710 [Treponema denticola]
MPDINKAAEALLPYAKFEGMFNAEKTELTIEKFPGMLAKGEMLDKMESIAQNEKILYIGIDVHKDTYALCCFDFQKNGIVNIRADSSFFNSSYIVFANIESLC